MSRNIFVPTTFPLLVAWQGVTEREPYVQALRKAAEHWRQIGRCLDHAREMEEAADHIERCM